MSVGGRIQGGLSKLKKKHFRVKHQKVKLFRASEPLLSVFMWGVNHTVRPFFAYQPFNRTLLPPPGGRFRPPKWVSRCWAEAPHLRTHPSRITYSRKCDFYHIAAETVSLCVYLFWRFLFIFLADVRQEKNEARFISIAPSEMWILLCRPFLELRICKMGVFGTQIIALHVCLIICSQLRWFINFCQGETD